MIETTEQATPVEAAAPVSTRGAALAIGLMSFSALLLELGLTRLFSVVLFYHFAFLAISIALLGLGAGAVFAYLRREWLERWSVGQLGAWLCAANAVVIFVVLEIVVRTAVSLHLDWSNFRHFRRSTWLRPFLSSSLDCCFPLSLRAILHELPSSMEPTCSADRWRAWRWFRC